MNQQLLKPTETVVCALELALIDAKELLQLKDQKVKELQSILSDKEAEINFLREVLSARADFVLHQNNIIDSLQKKLDGLRENAGPPVIVMKTYLPTEEPFSETAI